MNENESLSQQEIAPCTKAVSQNYIDENNNSSTSAPAEQNQSKKARGFFNNSTRRLTYLATFVALTVVTNMISIPITAGFYITFTYIPVFFAGIFFGPLAGFTVGITGDLLGALIAPKGAYIPLIGLASGLLGLIPALVFKIRCHNKFIDSPYFKIVLSMTLVLIICTAGLNTFSLWWWFSSHKKTFWVYLIGRFPLQTSIAAANAILIGILYPVLKKSINFFV